MSLGNQAARDGFSVRYQRLTRLLDELALARVDGKATRLLAQLARIRLLIIDDWAMTRLTAEQRRDLMEVVDDRHQRALHDPGDANPGSGGMTRSAIRPTPTPSSTASSTMPTASSCAANQCAAANRIRLGMKRSNQINNL